MIRQALRRLLALYDEMYQAPYRRIERRAQRRKDDLFRLMVLSESLGVPNPAAFYTLELVPFMLEDFHEWHQRMGMEHSPLEGFRCC
ncbi:MAG: cory-CC-star protein [Halospina sp.]